MNQLEAHHAKTQNTNYFTHGRVDGSITRRTKEIWQGWGWDNVVL